VKAPPTTEEERKQLKKTRLDEKRPHDGAQPKDDISTTTR